MLPFSYALRNLLRDPWKLIQKVGGSCLVVFLVFAAGSFNRGMEEILRASGSRENAIILGAGSEESVERSEIALQTESHVTSGIRGIEKRLGVPAVSGEVHYMGVIEIGGQGEAQALLRGVTPAAFEVHQEASVVEGRYPRPGEVLVGRLAWHTLGVPEASLEPGAEITFEGQTLKIAGLFAAPGTVMESEVWMNRTDLMTLAQRESLSCVVIHLESEDDYREADLFCKQRFDLELVAIRESDYYARLARFYGPIRGMTWLTAGLVGAGAVFGGLNMLYAAFASRIRELGTLQAVGFPRSAILVSLVQESLLAVLLGTLLAALLAVWLLEGVNVPFSIGTFQLTLQLPIILLGLGTGVALGTLGALPPALRCLGAPLPAALRG